MTAHHKVSLLLANKAIWREASPFFHRLHELRLLIRDYETSLSGPLPHPIQQVLRGIAKVRLVDQRRALDIVSMSNLGYYIAFLERDFTELKSLKTGIGIRPRGHDLHVINELQRLWPRLDYLQLVAEYYYEQTIESILLFIAPGLKWSQENGRNYSGRYGSWRRLFYLDRAHLEKGVTQVRRIG